jgi:hypothetical protein
VPARPSDKDRIRVKTLVRVISSASLITETAEF